MSSRFIHIVAYIRYSFLFMAEYFIVLLDHFFLPTYQFTDTWVLPSFSLFWITLLWTVAYNLLESLLSVLWGIYLEVELLDYIVILFLILRNHHTISTAAALQGGSQFWLHVGNCFLDSLFIALIIIIILRGLPGAHCPSVWLKWVSLFNWWRDSLSLPTCEQKRLTHHFWRLDIPLEMFCKTEDSFTLLPHCISLSILLLTLVPHCFFLSDLQNSLASRPQ